MLDSTYIHLPGIGHGMEQRFWKKGLITWDDYLEKGRDVLGSSVFRRYESSVKKSIANAAAKNHCYFSYNLDISEHWRGYSVFQDKACFLDIETTGLSKERNKITTIGIHDASGSRVLVAGKDLDKFPDMIKDYSMIVTFNGRCFDIPFIQHKFGITIDHLHVDLRFVMKELGYTGGLKKIEKQIGISREDDIAEVDGYEAVRLWKRYERGDDSALQTLIEYNTADVENLRTMMDLAYTKMRSSLMPSNNPQG